MKEELMSRPTGDTEYCPAKTQDNFKLNRS
jgi:hypothetical protein